jgi:uncharacterized YigZ family protein
MSDDGEPSGTAGKPMLNVLEHSGIGNIGVVVVRYFGGIKLGTGGLVRAYTSSVSEAVKQLDCIQKVVMEMLTLTLPYAEEAQVRYLLGATQGNVLEVSYSDVVTIACQLPLQKMDDFKARLGFDIVIENNAYKGR